MFDQSSQAWHRWTGTAWEKVGGSEEPCIEHIHFTGTGSRNLTDAGAQAIRALYDRSFG
ncbi:MAG: hypothetical protein VYB08_15025 [Candidatus Latescibacterota bacterium]|nr:hypothetical protein [Candidatus Latescibacterota bacterium]